MSSIEIAKQEIYRAFCRMPYPGDDNLLDNPNGNYSTCRKIQQVFTGRSWEELGLEDIYDNDEYLPFFSRVAYRYYLPAFLIVVLEHYWEEQISQVYISTLGSLLPAMRKHHFGIRDKWLFRHVDGLTESQKQAIKLFLETLYKLYDDEMAKEALKYFWHNPVR